MAHRRSFRGRSGVSQSQKRKHTWQSVGSAGAVTAGVSLVPATPGFGDPAGTIAASGISSDDAGAFLEGTIVRIRGSLALGKSTLLVAGSSSEAFGIGFVTNEAFNASAIPNPATAVGADWDGWLFYRSTPLDTVEANAGLVDSKAMRKWNDGMTLVLVAGAASDNASPLAPSGAQFQARILILLP